jgi:hypothetical protein
MLHIKKAGITSQIASLGCSYPKNFPTMEELKNVTRQDPRNPKTVKK